MIASERRMLILRMLQDKGVINLHEAVSTLGSSEATVRRDFEKLEREGKLQRVQGGAMLQDWQDSIQPSMHEKRNVNLTQKRMVSAHAAELVLDGQCVFLDCGTSIVPLWEILMKRPVKIVSNSSLLLSVKGEQRAELFLLGGTYSANNNMTYGTLTKHALQEFYFDHAFIGCFGFSAAEGKAYTLELDSAEVKQTAMKKSRQCHLLADDSKLERQGFYAFAELSDFQSVIYEKKIERMVIK